MQKFIILQLDPMPPFYCSRLTRAGAHLAEMLEELGRPIISSYDLHRLIQGMHREHGKKLRLRRETPTRDDYKRLQRQLRHANVIRRDQDYGTRFRVLAVSDLPADEIVCLVDRLCHVSHLSAMQRWGMTDRVPKALMITRPDNGTAQARLRDIMAEEGGKTPFPPRNPLHPEKVRHRPVQVHESKYPGTSIRNRNSFMRLATASQTFLDMLREPDLCGGMSHVLDVWRTHADIHLEGVVKAVDASGSAIVKCRAGYIIEEILGLENGRVETWKAFAQRGGSRRLDPSRKFVPEHSESWMISLNA